MLSKKELLTLAMRLENAPNYEYFYRFVQDYAFHLAAEKQTDTGKVFACIEYCKREPKAAAPYIPIRTKYCENLVNWCEYILHIPELRTLSMTELNYLFAICARCCKAKSR
jgi:hypothetical protein